MIEIKDLKEEDKGRVVKYTSNYPKQHNEWGMITSWNDEYIFVDYSGSERGTATRPINLEFDDTVSLSVNREGRLVVKPKKQGE